MQDLLKILETPFKLHSKVPGHHKVSKSLSWNLFNPYKLLYMPYVVDVLCGVVDEVTEAVYLDVGGRQQGLTLGVETELSLAPHMDNSGQNVLKYLHKHVTMWMEFDWYVEVEIENT